MGVDLSIGKVGVMFVSEYDGWRLASPPEAEEEDMEVSCYIKDDDGQVCSFEGKVTAQVDKHRYYWSCPTCDWDHEEIWDNEEIWGE